MATHSAMIKGAARVFVVDAHDDRLKLAAELGGIPVDMRRCDPVEEILGQTDGLGTDRGCECVGYQCCDRHGREANYYTMNNLVASTKATGGIGVLGVFVPQDPGASDELAKQGKMAFDFGAFWFKGQQIRTGQANVKAYNRRKPIITDCAILFMSAEQSLAASSRTGLALVRHQMLTSTLMQGMRVGPRSC